MKSLKKIALAAVGASLLAATAAFAAPYQGGWNSHGGYSQPAASHGPSRTVQPRR